MSDRINPQNNNQITSIQVCVMGFFLLKVGPPLEKCSGSAPVLYVDYAGSAQCACVSCSQKPVFPTCDPGKQIKFKRN